MEILSKVMSSLLAFLWLMQVDENYAEKFHQHPWG